MPTPHTFIYEGYSYLTHCLPGVFRIKACNALGVHEWSLGQRAMAKCLNSG